MMKRTGLPELPTETLSHILAFAWPAKDGSRAQLYTALRLVSRRAGAVVARHALEHVVCVNDADYLLYLHLVDRHLTERGFAVALDHIVAPDELKQAFRELFRDRHVLVASDALASIRRVMGEKIGMHSPSLRALTASFERRNLVAYPLFADARALTMANASVASSNNSSSLRTERDESEISILRWIAQAASLTTINMSYAINDMNTALFNPISQLGSVWANALPSLINTRITEFSLTTESVPLKRQLLLDQLFPGVQRLTLTGPPIPLRRVFTRCPAGLRVLVLGSARFSGGHSIQHWCLSTAIRNGLCRAPGQGDSTLRIVVLAGIEDPMGWKEASAAAQEHGVDLSKEVEY
jgi:hypothetical protein